MTEYRNDGLINKYKRYIIIAFVFILISTSFMSGCSIITENIQGFISSKPTSDTVLINTVEVTTAVEEALKNGKTEATFDVMLTHDEIKALTTNLSPFWGMPTEFRVLNEYSDIEIERDGVTQTVDVSRVSFSLEQSINYYLYQKYKDTSFEIPTEQKEATEIFDAFYEIVNSIFDAAFDHSASSYEKALKVHDYLVEKLYYDTSIDMISKENGTYGAIKNKATMCQGYSEALMLILISATDVDAKLIVGEANNGNGEWIGHAWNLVYMEDAWYHVDATFSDPVSNVEGQINHFYFGQNDAFMLADHSWDAAFWPAATGTDFLFYRMSGLFAESVNQMKDIIGSKLDDYPFSIEVVANGFEVKDSHLQFIYSENSDVTSIYRSLLPFGNATILQISLEY